MRKATGTIFVILGGFVIATVIGTVTLRSVAGRSLDYIQLLLWLVLGTALLHWGSQRLAKWPMILGMICVLYGGFNLARALVTAEVLRPDNPLVPIAIEFRLVDDSPASVFPGTPLRGTEEVLHLESIAALTEEDIATARQMPHEGSFDVELLLTREGSRKFEHLTAANVGRGLGVMVDGVLLIAPVILVRIPGGSVNIEGGFSEEEAASIVHRINQDTDLVAAARPAGAIAGLILLTCGSVLILVRQRIPASSMTRFAGMVFLIVGVSCIFLVLIGIVLSIPEYQRLEWESLLFLLGGLALLVWGARLSKGWRIIVGLACLVFSASLLIFPAVSPGRSLPTDDPFRGWTSRMILGLALAGTGAVLIAAWRRRRRSAATQG